MSTRTTASEPSHRFAVVGAGPSGFFSAEALLAALPACQVDVYEKLPAPYGLVRYGVAPDHQKLKQTAKAFERTADDPRLRFLGNVEIGADVPVAELAEHYDAVVLAHGASDGKKPGLLGEHLAGCHTATEFVGWYNGHPDFQGLEFDLSSDAAVIVGQGNVALDVARILARPIDQLCSTDITERALAVLAGSRIKTIHIVGRRSSAQAKFSHAELRELFNLEGVAIRVDPEGFALNASSRFELNDKANFVNARNQQLFEQVSESGSGGASRQIIFHFLQSPSRILGDTRVGGIELTANILRGEPFSQVPVATGQVRRLKSGVVFLSIGYQGKPLPGLPFDTPTSTYPHHVGKLEGFTNVYAAGWIKRGATGIIGTNKPCAQETVATLLAEINATSSASSKRGFESISHLLVNKRVYSFDDWRMLDAWEVEQGRRLGKVREKVVDFTSLQ